MVHARRVGAGRISVLGTPATLRVRIEAAVDDGADAVMTTFGVAKRYREQLTDRIPTILRLDGGPSLYREDWLAHTEWSLLHSVEDALFLGADGVVLMAFVGIRVELQTYRVVATAAGECVRVGLPLMVEALPCPSASQTLKPPRRWPPRRASALSTARTSSRPTTPKTFGR